MVAGQGKNERSRGRFFVVWRRAKVGDCTSKREITAQKRRDGQRVRRRDGEGEEKQNAQEKRGKKLKWKRGQIAPLRVRQSGGARGCVDEGENTTGCEREGFGNRQILGTLISAGARVQKMVKIGCILVGQIY